MSILSLTLLGPVQVSVDQQPITRWATDKALALLIYLAMERRPHRRHTLAALLWPGYDAQSAANSFRVALYQLRQAIGDQRATPPWLLITRQQIELNPAATVEVDALHFQALLTQSHAHHHAPAEQTTCPVCLPRLQQAAADYQGEFLSGFAPVDSTPFEEWRRIMQEQLHLHAIDLFGQLSTAAIINGQDEEAYAYALRQLTLEPWQESAHRQVMRLLAQRGERAAAIAQYNTCRQVLAEEFGTEPEVETQALAEEIRSGRFEKRTSGSAEEVRAAEETRAHLLEPDASDRAQRAASGEWQDQGDTRQGDTRQGGTGLAPVGLTESLPNPVSTTRLSAAPLCDWGEMPAVDFFAGRTAELAQLKSWLAAPEQGAAVRFITILGIGGMGKTTLAAVAAKAVAPGFTTVIWRSLLNAPPLTELVSNWLQILARHTLTALPTSHDDQLRLLIDYLRQQRCLLVLDNVESILQPADSQRHAGELRPGYEGYAQLFHWLATSDHQSCLLLTGREQPYLLTQLGRQDAEATGPVRRLALGGLTLAAGHAVLQSNGLHPSSQEAEQLVHHYSGNPLALQIVATTIADFFGGDIPLFAQEGGFFFDGIRTVLDQQFARLSPLEHDILVWLAIEREAVSVATLRGNLLQSHLGLTTGNDVIAALRSLQQRALIEKSGNGLALQNVIIEYTTDYLVEQVYQELCAAGKVLAAQSPPSFLKRFALLKAQSKEYVRQSQTRLIVQPLAERLVAHCGLPTLVQTLQTVLARLERQSQPLPSYAAGNLINLLLHLGCEVRGADFAQLAVWQAYLREATLFDVNFAGADLKDSNFRKPFTFIWAVTYSPDGHYLAGGGLDGTVFLWQTSDGQAVQVYQGQTALVYALAFSRDGKWLVAGGEDKTICVWERQSGHLRYRLHDHNAFVNTVAFSPDSTHFASAADDQTVRIWDVARGHTVQQYIGHQARVNSVTFDPSGRLIVSGSDDGSVQLWEIATGTLIHRWVIPTPIYTVAFTPDGHGIMGGGDDRIVRCWDVATGELRHALHGHAGDVRSLAVHPNGTLLASSGGDETVRLWDLVRGECVQMIHAHQRCVTTVVFSPDGQTVTSSSHDGTICLSDVQSGRLLQRLNGYGTEVIALTYRCSGDLLAATIDNGAVRIWDGPTGYPRHLLHGYTKEAHATVFHPYQPLVASGCDDTYIRVWDLENGRLRWLCAGHTRGVVAVAISHHGARVAGHAGDGQVRIWDAPAVAGSAGASAPARAPLYRRIDCPAQRMFTLAFSPDDAYLAGGYEAGIYLWPVAGGEALPIFMNQPLGTVSLAFSPDGTILATGREDHTIALWSFPGGELRAVLRHHRGTIYALAFSPDGSRLVSASGDHTIALWDVQSGTLLWTGGGHHSRVLSAIYHRDGKRIATGSFDGVVKCWDVENGACLETFTAKGPYAGMKIAGVLGINEAQKAALLSLGAVEA